MNTNKGSIVKQSGNDVEGCRSEMVLVQPNMRVFLQYSVNKEECDLNQSLLAKNNNWNNGDRHKIHEVFLINCFVLVTVLFWRTVHSFGMTQITANLMEKTLHLTVLW